MEKKYWEKEKVTLKSEIGRHAEWKLWNVSYTPSICLSIQSQIWLSNTLPQWLQKWRGDDNVFFFPHNLKPSYIFTNTDVCLTERMKVAFWASWAKMLFGHLLQNAMLWLLFQKRLYLKLGRNLLGLSKSSVKDSRRTKHEREVGQNRFFPSQNCTQTSSGTYTIWTI